MYKTVHAQDDEPLCITVGDVQKNNIETYLKQFENVQLKPQGNFWICQRSKHFSGRFQMAVILKGECQGVDQIGRYA